MHDTSQQQGCAQACADDEAKLAAAGANTEAESADRAAAPMATAEPEDQHDQAVIRQIRARVFNRIDSFQAHRLGGMTNHNYRVTSPDFDAVFRIPGSGTEDIVDRAVEGDITQAASVIGVDSKLLYFDPDTGIKVVRTVPNAQTMHVETMHQPENRALSAKLLRKLHTEAAPVNFRFDVFQQIPRYENSIRQNEEIDWEGYAEMRNRIMGFQDQFADVKPVTCHCDPLCENFVKDTVANRMYLIDWEYGGMNDPLWDVADVCIEVGYDREERLAFEEAYFGRPATKAEDQRVVVNMVLIDFLWALWGLQRSWYDHNLDSYGPTRYERARRNLALLDE